MSRALFTFLKVALLFFFIASIIFVLIGIIILQFQVRHIAKSMFWSEVQGQKTQIDIDRLAMLVERNTRDIIDGRDALEALFAGAVNFSVLQRRIITVCECEGATVEAGVVSVADSVVEADSSPDK
jgi:hypothetical protein